MTRQVVFPDGDSGAFVSLELERFGWRGSRGVRIVGAVAAGVLFALIVVSWVMA